MARKDDWLKAYGVIMFAVFTVALSGSASGQETIRFAVIGDFGGSATETEQNHINEAAVATLVHSWNVDFILTTGDNNYELGGADTIDQNIGQFYSDFIGNYQGTYGSGSVTNRFFPSLGNHDYITDSNAQPYLDYFTLPGNERYYDFVRGDAHFFAINSDGHEPDGNSATSVQAQWLQTQLAASTSEIDDVYFHHPPYSSGQHGNNAFMQWDFKDWGADLVLTGHDHDYERIKVSGLTYIVNGLGGKGGRDFPGDPLPGTVVRYRGSYGAQLIEVTGDQLRSQFIITDGTVIDDFILNMSTGGDGGVTPNLRFTEIMADPAGSNEWEWVEIYNAGLNAVDLTGLRLVDGGHNTGILGSGTIAPGETVVLIRSDGAGGRTLEGYKAAWGDGINFITVESWPGLANSGESIELRDANGTTIAFVNYGNDGIPDFNDSASIYLIDANADPSDPMNWMLSVAGVDGAYGACHRVTVTSVVPVM